MQREEDETIRRTEDAGAVAARREKAFETETLARFKELTKEIQTRILDFGMYVYDVVAPRSQQPGQRIRRARTKLKHKNLN